MVMIVRLSVWDEIQEAIRARPPEPEALQEFVVMNGLGLRVSTIYATLQGRPLGCDLCSHVFDVHSRILPFAPCLDCDCIGWTVRPPPPNPSRRTR